MRIVNNIIFKSRMIKIKKIEIVVLDIYIPVVDECWYDKFKI